VLTRAVLLQLADNKKMESFVRRNPISAPLVRRFIAGETLEEATEPVRALNARGISVSLDFLGESVSNREEVAASVDTYLRVFQHIRCESLDANVSLKLTALGLDLDPEMCYCNMLRLLSAAGPDLFIRIDMESSAYTQRTLDLFARLWDGPEPHKNVGVVIQSYLYRSGEDVEKLIAMGARVRLVKGAYKEPASVAYPAKADVDRNFLALMERLLLKGNYPAIATHDSKIIGTTKAFARENKIAPDHFEFQMLYGIRRDLQSQLVNEGFRMRVYSPFGSHWYPYLMRRLAERPANLWFVAKNLLKR